MFAYQRLCEITGVSKKDMKLLININKLPSSGLVELKPFRKYGKTFYNFMYRQEDEEKILKELGLVVKNQISNLKVGFN
ncbi:hypothetical protein ACV30V_03400 [Clostridium perfringens]|nr:hypothetical protein [Clostridium perfringens]